MKKCILSLLCLAIALGASSQNLNLDFETILDEVPSEWFVKTQPGFSITLDSVDVQSGKYSITIERTGDAGDCQPISYVLPENYGGERIYLSGYIKTENVTDGYVGLWMRIDPDVAFGNMAQQKISGTTDWTKYEISLQMDPARTEQIFIGALLVGKGKVWFDNFSVTIDGKEIAEAKIVEKKIFLAKNDKEFDTGSGVVFPSPLGKPTIDNLELLGKLWGFMKYHHPAVAKGDYNWDYELFRILPAYLNTKNDAERDAVLLGWIGKFGEIAVGSPRKDVPEDAYIKPDLTWIENLNGDLQNKIRKIYAFRNQGEHYYIDMAAGVGNLVFLNENPYSDMPYPDAGFRLLSLYRYWNMVQYFFPYKYVTDKDWNDVLKEYISTFLSANDELEYELAVLGIIGEVGDTHANLWGGGDKINALRGNNFAPFRIGFVEDKAVVNEYFNPELKEASGIEIGDVITHIGGRSVEAIVDSLLTYYPASNRTTKLRNIAYDLLRSQDDKIDIRYISSGAAKRKDLQLYPDTDLKRHPYNLSEGRKCYELLEGNIGYITLANIKDEDIPAIKEAFRDTRGIVIDIRNYPPFMPFSLATYFVSKDARFVRFSIGTVDDPGMFILGSLALSIPQSDETYRGKLVVIVNEISQSRAEYMAMAFRAGDNTTIIGSQTAGANGDISSIMLPGGLFSYISGIGVYYPDGTKTQRIGIVPDVKVEPTIEGIKQGRDELLEKAVEIIKKS